MLVNMNGEECKAAINLYVHQYIHVMDMNTNVSRLVTGPQKFFREAHEKIILWPRRMIKIPPMMYCEILNPVRRNSDGSPIFDSNGQVALSWGEIEYRFYQEPFPLYPGEKMMYRVKKLPVLRANMAFRLNCLVDFVDEKGHQWIAGDQFLFPGPGTYYPRKEVEISGTLHAKVLRPFEALLVEAQREYVDSSNVSRKSGEQWLVRGPCVYLPGAYENVLEKRKAHILTRTTALHLRALNDHKDEFGVERHCGQEWLVTPEMTDCYICAIDQELVRVVNMLIMNVHQYCIIENPLGPDGAPQLGKRIIVRGPKCLFLQPGEKQVRWIEHAYVLNRNEGLLVRADEEFVDDLAYSRSPTFERIDEVAHAEESPKMKVVRKPGDRWIVYGPCEYIAPLQVTVLDRRSVIPLDTNEGIYVRNIKTGQIRAVIGQPYMLNEDEKLWSKPLPDKVIPLLYPTSISQDKPTYKTRHDFTRVVTYRVPHNAAVQVYDHVEHRTRVEFGPGIVMLGPHEQFTRLSLSGGHPKQPHQIQLLCLYLGPDFITDQITVETADHAYLTVKLAYNWKFILPSTADASELFSVPDFIGDVCYTMASRIRGVVAAVGFDHFHRNSIRTVHTGVFGLDTEGKIRDRFIFPHNHLHINGVDVQWVEPADRHTHDLLQKSIQLAIEITINSQEAAARHKAERLEQEALGRLERQRIEDDARLEEANRTLVQLRTDSAALESVGQARAEAQSRAEASRILAEVEVLKAQRKAEASAIEMEAELDRLKRLHDLQLDYEKKENDLRIQLFQQLVNIQIDRFSGMVEALGADTLGAIARSSSDQDWCMLRALGLHSALITDGNTPINLLNTTEGLIGRLPGLEQKCLP